MRVIDGDKLKKFFDKLQKKYGDNIHPTWSQLVGIVDKCPTIDSVQVVRCKDCNNRVTEIHNVHMSYCEVWGADVKEDGYCSYGVRKGGSK